MTLLCESLKCGFSTLESRWRIGSSPTSCPLRSAPFFAWEDRTNDWKSDSCSTPSIRLTAVIMRGTRIANAMVFCLPK